MPARGQEATKNIRYFLIYLIISSAFFHKAFLDGVLLAPGDGIAYFYPLRVIAARIVESAFPLWNPYIYSGFPFFAAIQTAVLYPPNWLGVLLSHAMAFNLSIIFHHAASAFFTYLYARLIGARDLAAFAAGIIFAFAGFTAAHLQHTMIIHSSVWLPVLLFIFEKLRKTLDVKCLLAASLAISLQVFAGHPQTVFQSFLILAFFMVFFACRMGPRERIRFIGLCFLAVFLSVLITLPQLVATFELIRLSPRADMSYKFFTSFSFPPHLIPTVFFPFLWGKGYGGKYWGPFVDYTGTEGFIGILPVVLAAIVFLKDRKGNPHIRFWGIIGIAAFTLSFGRYLPFYEILWHLPIFNLFRASGRHWFEVDFAVAVLFSMGLTYLLERKSFYRSAAIVVLIALIAITIISLTLFKEPLYRHITSSIKPMSIVRMADALSLKSPAIYIPLLFMLSYVFWLLTVNLKAKSVYLKYLILPLVIAEALSFRTNFGLGPKRSEVTAMCGTGAFGFLVKQGEGRTAFMHEKLQPMQGAMCGLKMLEAFEELAITRYNDLLDLDTAGVFNLWPVTLQNNAVLSMLNARYIVVSPRMEGVISMMRKDDRSVYKKVFSEGGTAVYLNRNALPLAFSISNLKGSPDYGDIKKRLLEDSFDPAKTAIVSEKDLAETGNAFTKGNVRVVSYKPGKVVLNTDFGGRGFVILSEQYYSGWKAFIDGKSTSIYQTNGVLKGVVVPEGAREVIFVYRPFKIYASFGISILTLTAIVFFLSKGKRWKPKGAAPSGDRNTT